MTTIPASRNQTIPIMTLADVLAAVVAADLPTRRRQEMASAVRTIGRALERPLAELPAHPRLIGPRLREVAPIASGISPRRWNNVRSLALASLALVQPVSPGRHRTKLSPGWQNRSDQLDHQGLRIALSRFMRFCSALGVEPDAVTENTVESYREHLEQTLKRPREILSMTAKAWHRAQRALPDWPKTVIDAEVRQRCWMLSMSALSDSFCKDCEIWLDWLAGRDVLDEMPFRPVRPATIEIRRRQLRIFASALILRGRNPNTITSLHDIVQIDAFRDGLRFLLGRTNGKPTRTIHNIAIAVKAVARHYLRVDTAHLESLSAIVRRLSPGPPRLTEKNQGRLRPFDDLNNATALIYLPRKLMALADRARHCRDGALQAQIAVAITILTFAPIRLNNLANLDIERNLVRSGGGKALHVVIPGEEVKNREPIEHPSPPISVELIIRYLRDFRPYLANAGNTALFPGKFSSAKRQHVLAAQISRAIFVHPGLKVNPHLFRHIVAKLYLDRNPGAYEVVRRVLGHRSINTTIAFYTGMETAAAARHFDQTILAIGRGTPEEISKRGTRKK